MCEKAKIINVKIGGHEKPSYSQSMYFYFCTCSELIPTTWNNTVNVPFATVAVKSTPLICYIRVSKRDRSHLTNEHAYVPRLPMILF